MKALYFDVNRIPLVAIDCATMGMRRYVGRECTHEAKLEGQERGSGREVRDMIELFRVATLRALRGSQPPAPAMTDQPVPA